MILHPSTQHQGGVRPHYRPAGSATFTSRATPVPELRPHRMRKRTLPMGEHGLVVHWDGHQSRRIPDPVARSTFLFSVGRMVFARRLGGRLNGILAGSTVRRRPHRTQRRGGHQLPRPLGRRPLDAGAEPQPGWATRVDVALRPRCHRCGRCLGRRLRDIPPGATRETTPSSSAGTGSAGRDGSGSSTGRRKANPIHRPGRISRDRPPVSAGSST